MTTDSGGNNNIDCDFERAFDTGNPWDYVIKPNQETKLIYALSDDPDTSKIHKKNG